MKEYTFISSKTPEEMEEEFNDVSLFEEIKAGLEEALAYEKGKVSAITHKIDKNSPTREV